MVDIYGGTVLYIYMSFRRSREKFMSLPFERNLKFFSAPSTWTYPFCKQSSNFHHWEAKIDVCKNNDRTRKNFCKKKKFDPHYPLSKSELFTR